MQHDRLVDALEHEQPRLIYTVPTFQNPTGAVMSARRRALCALAEQYGVPILEDDHVREVRFGQPIPRWPPSIVVGTSFMPGFTKSLIPSLRIGYVVARGPLREALIARKRTVDLFGSAMQRALTTFLEWGGGPPLAPRQPHLSPAPRRAACPGAAFSSGSQWSGVSGGGALGAGAGGVSVAALHDAAAAAGVGFARGAAFFPEPADQPYLRLNFAAVDEAEIERGIAVLGLVQEHVRSGGLTRRPQLAGGAPPASASFPHPFADWQSRCNPPRRGGVPACTRKEAVSM